MILRHASLVLRLCPRPINALLLPRTFPKTCHCIHIPIHYSVQIMLSSYYGHAPLVTLLLQHGADPDRLNDRGQSPLAGAVFKNEREVIRALLVGNADPRIGEPSAR